MSTQIAWRRSGRVSALHLTDDGRTTLCGVEIPRQARPGYTSTSNRWFETQSISLDVTDETEFDEADGTNSRRECKRCQKGTHR